MKANASNAAKRIIQTGKTTQSSAIAGSIAHYAEPK
jgi:hypothetical protein